MVLRFVGVFLALLLFSCGANSSSIEKDSAPEEVLSGEVLYVNNCAACHGADGKLGASGAKDLTQSTMTEKEIVELLKNGRNAMPVMKEILRTEENMSSVSKFVIEFQQ